MSQNNEEIVLKSLRVLHKSGYSEEAKSVLEKLDSPEAKALLAKMGGARKAKGAKNSSVPVLVFGFLLVAVFAFVLGWTLAPKNALTLPENLIDTAGDAELAATATEGREIFEATLTAVTGANENAMTQISASQTSAVEAATATAAARGQ